jgi:hypothetical protein
MKRMGSGVQALLTVFAAAALVGCSDGMMPDDAAAPAGVSNEAEAMEFYATQDAFVVNAVQTFSDESLNPEEVPPIQAAGQEIIPLSAGRFVDEVTVTATTTFDAGDTTATVQIDREMIGAFRILAKYNEDDTTTFVVEKPFTDHSTRNILFKRVGRDTDRFWLNWTPIATSLVVGGTMDAPLPVESPTVASDIYLTELQFVKPNGETIVITDPLDTFLRYHWMNISAGRAHQDVPEMSMGEPFTVRATLVSASPDTDLVALRYGFSLTTHTRLWLPLISETDNGDGTFTRTYELTAEVRHHPGFFHAGLLAATRETLFDDDITNYSVSWWGIPYRVR